MGAEIITIRLVTSIELDVDAESALIAVTQRSPGTHMYLVADDVNEMYHAVEPFVCRGRYTEFRKNHIELQSHVVWTGPREVFEAWFKQYENKTPYLTRKMFGFLTWFACMRRWLSAGREGATCQWFSCWFLIDMLGYHEFERCEFMMPIKVMALAKMLIPDGGTMYVPRDLKQT